LTGALEAIPVCIPSDILVKIIASFQDVIFKSAGECQHLTLERGKDEDANILLRNLLEVIR
jgi:hypothetical protein